MIKKTAPLTAPECFRTVSSHRAAFLINHFAEHGKDELHCQLSGLIFDVEHRIYLNHVKGDHLITCIKGLYQIKSFTHGKTAMYDGTGTRSDSGVIESTSKLTWIPSVPSEAILMACSMTAGMPILSISAMGKDGYTVLLHPYPFHRIYIPSGNLDTACSVNIHRLLAEIYHNVRACAAYG